MHAAANRAMSARCGSARSRPSAVRPARGRGRDGLRPKRHTVAWCATDSSAQQLAVRHALDGKDATHGHGPMRRRVVCNRQPHHNGRCQRRVAPMYDATSLGWCVQAREDELVCVVRLSSERHEHQDDTCTSGTSWRCRAHRRAPSPYDVVNKFLMLRDRSALCRRHQVCRDLTRKIHIIGRN